MRYTQQSRYGTALLLTMPAAQLWRFGPFEFDERTGELRRGGLPIKLQEQPARVLALLLLNKDDLVTREQLRGHLWPNDTFVDFEHSLNTAIKKLREALEDSAERPTYVKTLPRKGYRFIAAVSFGPAPGAEQAAATNGATAGRTSAKATRPGGAGSRPFRLQQLWKIPAVAAACAALLALGWSFSPRTWRERLTGNSGRAPIRSVAVLPFENLSGDATQDYVADGLADFLTTDLARIHRLQIISRTSANRYKKTGKTVPEIARELGVDAVVEGSFLRSGNRVRITAQLIDARTDQHVWANNYEREANDVLALESELGHAVAREVAVNLSAREEASFASGHVVSPDAWDSYVKGEFFFSKRSREGYQESCRSFEQAIAQDPAFAQAYAGLAECTWSAGSFGLLPLQEATVKARAAALKAIELDGNSSDAHLALGYVLLFGDWDWAGAQREISRSLELNPNNSRAHSVYSYYQWTTGHQEEAITESRKAKELDPLNPSSSVTLGLRYLWVHQDDLAELEFREALNLDPNTNLAHIGLAQIYAQRKMYDQAAAERFAALSLSSSHPPELAAAFMKTYKADGYPAADLFVLKHYLKQSQELVRRGQPAACELGIQYAYVGDKNNALDWMEKGFDEHCRQMMDLKSGPPFDFLRNEPRFHTILQRMNLEPAR